ncbi:hypothetical protein HDU87_004510 [Geranomyces variabilis]|uniref:PKD/REJ-like domain-containing protein n=1 Tax=Geranomyces variabilis TaxID=109894 RepID=A0AAD5XRT9_9FUNG|nr:hypothetical protein HDU87_004510 [Geranomyces variabilis]
MRLLGLPGATAAGLIGLIHWASADFSVSLLSTCGPISVIGKGLPDGANGVQYAWTVSKDSPVQLPADTVAALANGTWGNAVVTIPAANRDATQTGNLILNVRVNYNVTSYLTATQTTTAQGATATTTMTTTKFMSTTANAGMSSTTTPSAATTTGSTSTTSGATTTTAGSTGSTSTTTPSAATTTAAATTTTATGATTTTTAAAAAATTTSASATTTSASAVETTTASATTTSESAVETTTASATTTSESAVETTTASATTTSESAVETTTASATTTSESAVTESASTTSAASAGLAARALVKRDVVITAVVTPGVANGTISISIQANAPPTVSIAGGVTTLSVGSSGASLTAIGQYSGCSPSATLTYLWTSDQPFPAGSVFTLPTLFINKGVFSGTYVTVTVTGTDSGTTTTANQTVTVQPLPHVVVAAIAGDSPRASGVNIPLLLDGSSSVDTNYPSATLTYVWTCAASAGGTCPTISSTTNVLKFDKNTLTVGTYTFTLTVTSSGVSGSAQTTVNVAATIPLSCTINYDASNTPVASIIASTVIGFRSSCVGDVAASATYSWSTTASNVGPSNILYGSITSSLVYLAPNSLTAGTYTFSLTATSGTASFLTTTTIVVHGPPSGGTFNVDGNFPGTAFTDKYLISAAGWSNPDTLSDPTLKYAFSYVTSDGVETSLGIRSPASSVTVAIPTVGNVAIYGRVYNSIGGVTSSLIRNVTLNALSAAQVDLAIVSQAAALTAAIASNDPQQVIAASVVAAALIKQSAGQSITTAAGLELAAARQDQVVTAMVNLAGNVKDSDTANSCAAALLSNDLSIMPAASQGKALNAVGQLAQSIIFDTTPGSVPLDKKIGGSMVNTMGNLFPVIPKSSSSLMRRQSTYSTKSADLITAADPSVAAAALTSAHQSGAAMSKGSACVANTTPSVQLLSGPATATDDSVLASQYVPLTGGSSSTTNLGYMNASIVHPSLTDPSYVSTGAASDANGAAGCTVSTALLAPGARGANSTYNYYAPVLSLSYDNPTSSLQNLLSGAVFDAYIPETQTVPANMNPECRIWDGTEFSSTHCTTLTDGVAPLVHCQCEFVVPATTSLVKRESAHIFKRATNNYPAVEIAVARVTAPGTGSGSNKLSGGAIAGITIGSVVGAAAIVAVGAVVAKKHSRPRTTAL